VHVVVKGKNQEIILSPNIPLGRTQYGELFIVQVSTETPFFIKPALMRAGVVLASSDLSRLKVTRKASAAAPAGEYVLDCSGDNAPAFWLRDGDVIEIPDK
jgi:hypothetical protein